MHIYEVEIKSLLGSKDKAQELKELLTKNNNLKFLSKGRAEFYSEMQRWS